MNSAIHCNILQCKNRAVYGLGGLNASHDINNSAEEFCQNNVIQNLTSNLFSLVLANYQT